MLIILIFLNCLNFFWTGIWPICSRILVFHFFLRCSLNFFLTSSWANVTSPTSSDYFSCFGLIRWTLFRFSNQFGQFRWCAFNRMLLNINCSLPLTNTSNSTPWWSPGTSPLALPWWSCSQTYLPGWLVCVTAAFWLWSWIQGLKLHHCLLRHNFLYHLGRLYCSTILTDFLEISLMYTHFKGSIR